MKIRKILLLKMKNSFLQNNSYIDKQVIHSLMQLQYNYIVKSLANFTFDNSFVFVQEFLYFVD